MAEWIGGLLTGMPGWVIISACIALFIIGLAYGYVEITVLKPRRVNLGGKKR